MQSPPRYKPRARAGVVTPSPFVFVLLLLLGSVLFFSQARAQSSDASASAFETAAAILATGSFAEKADAITAIATSGDPRALELLSALAEGDLFSHRKTKQLVYREKVEGGYALTDALTGEDRGVVKRRGAKKVGINNRLRGVLSGAIGGLQLFAGDADTRAEAIRDMMANLPDGGLSMLNTAAERETDTGLQELIGVARAAYLTQSGDVVERVAAVESLTGSMNPEVWQILGRLAAQDTSDDDKQVASAAAIVLEGIESRKQWFSLAETLFFGLSLGAVLFLAAVGLAITFGVMGVINMAHGEMLMLGAYTTFVVQQLMPNSIEYSLFVAIPAAFVITGLIGILIERSVIRVLYGRPLETLLATFGISLLLQQAVRSIFSPLNQPVITPEWMSGFYQVNGALSLTYNRLYIILFCVMVFVALMLVLRYTRLGLHMRAVTQNRRMAGSMGIRTGWVDALTFGLGSGIAGIGGVALS
ncbi:MAG: urea ABC transporter permease subunit UrtB, partial [Pseudomonadota bacterium]